MLKMKSLYIIIDTHLQIYLISNDCNIYLLPGKWKGRTQWGLCTLNCLFGLRKIAHYVMNQTLCMNGNKMKSGSTFKIPRNAGGNGYWSSLIPRVPNQVMTQKCAVMCVPLQYKPSVHHQIPRILSMNLL